MKPPRVTRPAPRPMGGKVWLHACDPSEGVALALLAHQLDTMPEGPATRLTGIPADPGPGDDPRALEAFIDAEQVALVVLAGSVLPVPLIDRAKARGLALMLVDTLTPRPTGRWRWLPGYGRSVLAKFAEIHTRDEVSAATLRKTLRGAVPVRAAGMLARNAPVAGCNAFELEALRKALDGRPAWFAYDLPEGEVDAALLAHAHALRRAHRLLLILQPRDPMQAEAMALRVRDIGFVCARRTLEEEITETTQVYIADAEDEAGLFLRLAPVAYLGGSLTPEAGTGAPLTAAALGSALVFGPADAGEHAALLTRLRQTGGGVAITLAADLGEAVGQLLAPEIGAEIALRAWTLATEGSEATLIVARAICDWMLLHEGRP